MKAIEFESKAHDGVFDIPAKYRDWDGKPVKVILLELPHKARTKRNKADIVFKAVSIQTRNYHFDRTNRKEVNYGR